jgi:hypothetical protein
LWLLFHLKGKYLYQSAKVLEDQMGDDLQNILDDLDQLIGVKLRNTFDIGTFRLEHPKHRGVQDGR